MNQNVDFIHANSLQSLVLLCQYMLDNQTLDFSEWFKIRSGLRMDARADDYLIVYLNTDAYSKNVSVHM